MTKYAVRRATAGGRKARVFSQTAPTNLKPLQHKPRTSAKHSAGPFIYRHIDVQRNVDFQRNGFAPRY
jgi:hypothetical protein